MYEYKCRITNVVDGDTVDAEIDLGFNLKSVFRVRLSGVDTHELTDKNIVNREKAVLAKDFVRANSYKVVRIKTKMDKKDGFGRVLGTLFYDLTEDISLNEDLITSGHAIPYML